MSPLPAFIVYLLVVLITFTTFFCTQIRDCIYDHLLSGLHAGWNEHNYTIAHYMTDATIIHNSCLSAIKAQL